MNKTVLAVAFCLGLALGALAAAGVLTGCAGAGNFQVENHYLTVDLKETVALVNLTDVATKGYKLVATVGGDATFASVRAVPKEDLEKKQKP